MSSFVMDHDALDGELSFVLYTMNDPWEKLVVDTFLSSSSFFTLFRTYGYDTCVSGWGK